MLPLYLPPNRIDSCHFEYPGSTHAIRVRAEHLNASEYYPDPEYTLQNPNESAATGQRSLKVTMNRVQPGDNIFVYKKTYYGPEDFHDSRYDPAFSPIAYPGQVIHGSVMLPQYGQDVLVSLYAREMHTGTIYQSEPIGIGKGIWNTLAYQIPSLDGAVIDETGFCVHMQGERGSDRTMAVEDNDIKVAVDHREVLEYQDVVSPYLEGANGISVQNCSRLKCRKIVIS